jgi:hypothetical protein
MATWICDVRFAPESGHSAVRSKCPLWARSGHQGALFDHLVGERSQSVGDLQLECLRGCAIYDQLEPRRLHDRQFTWLRAVDNTANIFAGLPIGACLARAVARDLLSANL